ncbi:unnamed protein product, partial [Phaeothamnion confervicola]
PTASEFIGDKRSFAIVTGVADWLAREQRRSLPALETWAELSDALASMLHHQLHEVVQKAADPAAAKVRARQTLSRIGWRDSVRLIGAIADALEHHSPAAPLPAGPGGGNGGAGSAAAAAAAAADWRLRVRLLTSALLLIRS